MTLDEPPEPAPPARMLGWVWIVAGALAIAIGVFATVFMVLVFGIVAVLLGLALQWVARLRDTSRARTARTLSGDPPPPATAPQRPFPEPEPLPEPEPEPEPEAEPEATDEDEHEDGDSDGAAGSEPDGAGTATREEIRPSEEVSISDVEDGYGEEISEQDRPGRRPGVADD